MTNSPLSVWVHDEPHEHKKNLTKHIKMSTNLKFQ